MTPTTPTTPPTRPLRVAVLGFHHESNTFAPVPASLDRFLAGGVTEGDEIVDRYGSSQATMAGFLELRDRDGVECTPLIHADLNPMGTITEEAFEHLVGRMIVALVDNGPWDVVLLALHGAAVASHQLDVDGDIISRVRAAAGPDVVIGVALDMHANVSRRMVRECDVLNTYLTNPHVDARQRAREVADLALATAAGSVRPVMALETPPLVIGILRQGTSDWPMRQLIDRTSELTALAGVLSVSVVEGFPYADVPEMGMSFIAVTDGDEALAADVACQLASEAWSLREQFVGAAADVDAALLHAAASTARPVVLLDVGDNVGGGSPADSTHVLSAAQRLGVRNLFHSLCDPAAVQHCVRAGITASVELTVGGRTDHLHGAPVAVAARVRHLDDGRFEDPGVTHGGFRFFDAGPRALLETNDGHFVLLTSRPMGNTSRAELTSVGLEPEHLQIIVAKGVQSPRAAYEPIAAEMIQLNTPGCTSADLSALAYRHRRRPMFPFEPEAAYAPGS
jgi:microcystin degradation protein MlrC